MRVILSRKGFDTTWGGGASPILPDGRMLSLPIPERIGRSEARYSVLRDESGATYLDLIRSLHGRGGLKIGGAARHELADETSAHLDPDLVPSLLPRDVAWRGLVGQSAAAAGHLVNQDVGPGDLFLFWGRFRRAESDANGSLRFATDSPRPFHAIWGYLQVAAVLDAGAGDAVGWAAGHPHFAFPQRGRPNVVYTARQVLSFRDARAGWGVFRWHERLRLTRPDSGTAGTWQLPSLFDPGGGVSVTYLLDRDLWTLDGDLVTVRVVGQKQELVVSEHPSVTRWACDLVCRSETWAP